MGAVLPNLTYLAISLNCSYITNKNKNLNSQNIALYKKKHNILNEHDFLVSYSILVPDFFPTAGWVAVQSWSDTAVS